MKFGKLANIETVNFDLPTDPSSNQQILMEAGLQEGIPRIFIGCTGWSMKEWVGSVYPKGSKSKDYLHHYSRQFNTIEMNTTHYRIPNGEMVDKWAQAVPDDFRFCPKIPQSISHSRDFGFSRGAVSSFCESIIKLEEKLGVCFMQLPPYFGLDRIKALELFLEQFPKIVPLAVEFRHASWFDQKEGIEQMLHLLNRTQKISLITDVAGRRDVAHMGLAADKVLIRFVGNGLHPTDYERIDQWVLKLKYWIEAGLKEVYFFPHEPDNILAPQLAVYLHQQIKEHIKPAAVRGPQLLSENDGEQMSLF